ncbi:abortive phage infection protein [Bacillus tropicus]|uniref:abortive phage infection protein n=1 Tax=Bacillus tropicus TaxID=2026188 RepID=UPI000BED6A7F|nr:abortive phage infection protein [Bacillus tropicus]PDY91097.1 abortive phage infection protein [Bacillus anthracis]PES18558.1 abortive phage infection protein [Bacillus anthracis]PEY28556.1 abortive phage infection protein [Bacillus anthracis]PFU91754.1 abortive phage infection protein [Bacillus anthracis]PGR20906.1 abortive phage infection protein [Bacillus anthracis]
MDKELANTILEQLKNGEIKEYVVTKDVFYTFREVLVNREDFKHFIGNAQRGGQVIYTYSETPRS